MTHPKLSKTKGFPLIGSIPSILRKPSYFWLESRNRYGEIYQLDLGMIKMIGLNHPDHVKHVLVNNASNYLLYTQRGHKLTFEHKPKYPLFLNQSLTKNLNLKLAFHR